MRVLVTGATGYIGRAVTRALVLAGHEVLGVGRDPGRLLALKGFGATPLRADLRDTKAWADALQGSAAVVHLAAQFPDGEQLDDLIVERVLDHAARFRSFECFVYTSGTMPFGNTGPNAVDEDSPFGVADVPGFVAWRPAHERRVLSASHTHGRRIVVRPAFVYGGDGGLGPLLRAFSPEGHAIRVPGSGFQRWSLVHIDDLASLFASVLTKGAEAVYHGAELDFVLAGDFADMVGRGLRPPNWVPWPVSEARTEIGSIADGLALDQWVGSSRARDLGWVPRSYVLRRRAAQPEVA